MLGLETATPLPLHLDTDLLLRDLKQAETHQFSSHPLTYRDGSWQLINLIHAGGMTQYAHQGGLGMGDAPPQRAPILDECRYLDEGRHN
jgi:hypothetical protein